MNFLDSNSERYPTNIKNSRHETLETLLERRLGELQLRQFESVEVFVESETHVNFLHDSPHPL